jgi:HK97 family phage major capsid protein
MVSAYPELLQQLQTHVKAAEAIAAKADRGEVTDTDVAESEMHMAKARELMPKVKEAKANHEIMATIAGIGAEIGGIPLRGSEGPATKAAPGVGSAWAKAVAGRIGKAAEAIGVKALTSGTIDVPSPVTQDIVTMPQNPRRILDLLVDRQALAGNTFEFLRQTVRTNNAAPVADSAQKPTSVFTVAPVEDRARVVAHLSEAIPERFLNDQPSLLRFLDSEMREGVLQALETQIMSGDGTGENFTGLLNTSGTLVDVFTTLRKARTALELYNQVPTAWVLHPSDIETIELTQDNEGRYYLGGPSGELNVTTVFGELPRIPSTAVPAGTAVLGDWSQLRLLVREDVRLDADKSGTLFEKNQIKLRAEGRFGFAVLRPAAFVEIDLTA